MRLFRIEKNFIGDEFYYEPRVPRYPLRREDKHTKRICCSASLYDAFLGSQYNLELSVFITSGMPLFFYYADVDEKYIHKPTIDELPDADITNEYWILAPTTFKCVNSEPMLFTKEVWKLAKKTHKKIKIKHAR